MFPQTLQCAVSPAKTLARQRPHRFRRFRPGNRPRHVNDPLPIFVQRESQIGVFRQCLQTQPASAIDRFLPDRADRARHHRDAVPTGVSATIEVESAGVLERLAARNECAQVSHFGVAGNGADRFVGERLE